MKDTNAEKSRLQWIDLFRGIAVIWMIETHTANTFLRPELLSADWFKWLNYFNGLVAPAFLFIAGVLQGRRQKPGVGGQRGGAGLQPLVSRLSRIGKLLLLGYALHFSIPSDGKWAVVFSHIDILQCMAVAMLVGLGIRPFGRGLAGAAALVVVLAAPLMSRVAPESVPVLVAGYLNRLNGSLFPLFPWAGFFFAGWFCQEFKIRECLIGAGVCWGVVWVQRFLPAVYPPYDYYLAGPGFFLERLGWMLIGVGCCQVWDFMDPMDGYGRNISAISRAGRSSLAIYVIHLQLINLLVWSAKMLGIPLKTGVPGMVAIFLGIAALSLTLAGLLGLLRGAPPYRWLRECRASASIPPP